MIMIIDPKNLIPLKSWGDFKKGGKFYRLEPDGQYSLCVLPEREFEDPLRGGELEHWTKVYITKGRLFLNRNKPWASITTGL